MRGTDVGISEKKNVSRFCGSLRSKKEGKTKFFFCIEHHFVNFLKFTKSLRQYLGNLITNNKVFSFFVSEDRCVLYLAHRLDLLFWEGLVPASIIYLLI